ncbi:MAG: transposase, partial [Methylococcales bacterium]|nr:transposase [Methylococcales bacterium]
MGELPSDVAGKGEYGVGVRSLIPLLKSECHLSERCILDFFQNFGIEVSSAYISNQWTKGYTDFHQEKTAIFEAGLLSTPYQQIDDTGARVKGQNHYTQIICNPFYSAYFTTQRKDRLTVLDVFRNFTPREFLYNSEAISLLDSFKLAKKIRLAIEQQLEKDTRYDEQTIDSLLDIIKPGPQQRTRIMEACAIAAYREQKEKPVIKILMCDDAPQFKLLTEEITLCWIHDGRHYKKLNPVVPLHDTLRDEFLTKYWLYYHKLLEYKEAPDPNRAIELAQQFDELFVTQTGYQQLDERIAKTHAKRRELLLVLKYPELPLHNNASELSARVQARARDISLHTMSEDGT